MKFLKIAIGFVAALAVIAVVVAIAHHGTPGIGSVSTSTSSVTFPTVTGSATSTPHAATLALATNTGTSLAVADFVHAQGTVAEPYTQSEYVLADDCADNAGCTKAASSNGFRIVYDQRDDSFNVLILAEPLEVSRAAAEAFLIDELGITRLQLCQLKATVGTVISVNSTFAGEELGFDGCANAVKLPS